MKKIHALFALPIAALFLTVSAFASDPSGEWTWSATTPQGKTIDSSAKLLLKDGKLTGSVTTPRGETPISEATFVDDQIQFSVSREGRDGEKRVTKYLGKVDATTIKGSIEMAMRKDDPKKFDWAAHRVASAGTP